MNSILRLCSFVVSTIFYTSTSFVLDACCDADFNYFQYEPQPNYIRSMREIDEYSYVSPSNIDQELDRTFEYIYVMIHTTTMNTNRIIYITRQEQ